MFNKNNISLKALLLDALNSAQKKQLAYRPNDIKFDEQASVFVGHLNNHQGLYVGDAIDLADKKTVSWPCIDTTFSRSYSTIVERVYEINDSRSAECYVVGFFKVSGHIKPVERNIGGIDFSKSNERISLEEIFCALSMTNPIPHILRKEARPGSPVLLFWAEGLVKSTGEYPS